MPVVADDGERVRGGHEERLASGELTLDGQDGEDVLVAEAMADSVDGQAGQPG